MKEFEEKLKKYINENKIDAKQLIFEDSCHTVEEAAVAVGAKPEDLVKNICLISNENETIIAIVKGENRVSTSKVKKVIGSESVKIATPNEIIDRTGYLCGGVPSFGFEATFIIDPKVMEKEIIYSGGGSPNSLLKISSVELQRANKGKIQRIRK